MGSNKSFKIQIYILYFQRLGNFLDKWICSFTIFVPQVEHEHRPRTKSFLFSFHVGSVWLRDCITNNSLFPLLVSPQSSESAPLHTKASQSRFTELARSIQTFLPAMAQSKEEEESPIFYFLYEKKPFNSKVDHRIHVKSQPLNVVYNPIVIKVVTEFFSLPEDLSTTSHLSDQIKMAALSRIQEAKQRTKEELSRNINHILKGNTLDRKIWDAVLGTRKRTYPDVAPHDITAVCLDDRRRKFFVGTSAGHMACHNYQNGACMKKFPPFPNRARVISLRYVHGTRSVVAAAGLPSKSWQPPPLDGVRGSILRIRAQSSGVVNLFNGVTISFIFQ